MDKVVDERIVEWVIVKFICVLVVYLFYRLLLGGDYIIIIYLV